MQPARQKLYSRSNAAAAFPRSPRTLNTMQSDHGCTLHEVGVSSFIHDVPVVSESRQQVMNTKILQSRKTTLFFHLYIQMERNPLCVHPTLPARRQQRSVVSGLDIVWIVRARLPNIPCSQLLRSMFRLWRRLQPATLRSSSLSLCLSPSLSLCMLVCMCVCGAPQTCDTAPPTTSKLVLTPTDYLFSSY